MSHHHIEANRRSAAGRIVATLLLGGLVLLASGSAAEAKFWESKEHNCTLDVPDNWTWLPASGDWEKYGIIKGAARILKTLKGGEAATGQRAVLNLAWRPAPEDKTVADLAQDQEIQKFLMSRFSQEPSEWPEITFMETTLQTPKKDEVAAIVMEVDGKALNSSTPEPCYGIMLLAIAKGKLYLLRLYAWHSEHDLEGLKTDIDLIAYNNFTVLAVADKTTGGGNGAPPPEVEVPEEAEGEEEVIGNREQRWRITKHKKLKRVELQDVDGEYAAFKLEEADQYGSYTIVLHVLKNSQIVNGVQAPPPDLKKGMTTTWWQTFNANHPEGELFRFKWPRNTKNNTFLTLPDLSEENRIHFAGGKKRRPIEASAKDMMKTMKVVEKPKNNFIGKRMKVVEPLRGIMMGKRPRYGNEVVLRFAWRKGEHSYRLYVTIVKEGYKRWGDAIRETLESMEFYKD